MIIENNQDTSKIKSVALMYLNRDRTLQKTLDEYIEGE